MIETGASADAISATALEEGMFDFRRAALQQLAQGITSFDEMRRALPITDSASE